MLNTEQAWFERLEVGLCDLQQCKVLSVYVPLVVPLKEGQPNGTKKLP